MTKTINRIAATGALLMLTGAVAFAQSEMKLDVPFAFHTPTNQMPAGKYYVTELGGLRSAPFFRLQHAETGKSALVVAPVSVERRSSEKGLPPAVSFKCAGDYCAIAEIFQIASTTGHAIPVKMKPAAGTTVATITIPIAAE